MACAFTHKHFLYKLTNNNKNPSASRIIFLINFLLILISSLGNFRRCLCELAKQIGFSQHAREIFCLEGQIASYRHLVDIS